MGVIIKNNSGDLIQAGGEDKNLTICIETEKEITMFWFDDMSDFLSFYDSMGKIRDNFNKESLF